MEPVRNVLLVVAFLAAVAFGALVRMFRRCRNDAAVDEAQQIALDALAKAQADAAAKVYSAETISKEGVRRAHTSLVDILRALGAGK